jgi:hypothetical protein
MQQTVAKTPQAFHIRHLRTLSPSFPLCWPATKWPNRWVQRQYC